jgi:hypothetical protein
MSITIENFPDIRNVDTWKVSDYEAEYINNTLCLIKYGDEYHSTPTFDAPKLDQWSIGDIREYLEWTCDHSQYLHWLGENYGGSQVHLEMHLEFWAKYKVRIVSINSLISQVFDSRPNYCGELTILITDYMYSGLK